MKNLVWQRMEKILTSQWAAIGAQICDLVGTFILSKISCIVEEQNSVGTYRDDGLDILRNMWWANIERKKQEIMKITESFMLLITVTTTVTSANDLDVNFDLTTDIYQLKRNWMMNLFTLINISPIPQMSHGKFHDQ